MFFHRAHVSDDLRLSARVEGVAPRRAGVPLDLAGAAFTRPHNNVVGASARLRRAPGHTAPRKRVRSVGDEDTVDGAWPTGIRAGAASPTSERYTACAGTNVDTWEAGCLPLWDGS